jgi:hypothetical protein
MAEPQPSEVQEGAADPHAPTATADDRKAAAALSSLDAQDDNGSGKKEADGKALDKAMKNLNVKGTKAESKKNVKVEPAQVNLLVSTKREGVILVTDRMQIKELDLNKQQATDLLKSYDGNTVDAITAFVTGKV